MAIILTTVSKAQITTLAENLAVHVGHISNAMKALEKQLGTACLPASVSEETKASAEAPYLLGEPYTDAEIVGVNALQEAYRSNAVIRDALDKFRNDVAPLVSRAQIMQLCLKAGNNDALVAQLEYLQNWRRAASHVPVGQSAASPVTHEQMASTVTGLLCQFIDDHKACFKGSDRTKLEDTLSEFDSNIKGMHRNMGLAERLCSTVNSESSALRA